MQESKWNVGFVYNVTDYFNKAVACELIKGVKDSNNKCIYEKGYFVCRDVTKIWIFRIQEGINSEYEKEPRTKIIETYSIYHADLMDFCIDKHSLDWPLYRDIDHRLVPDVLIDALSKEQFIRDIIDFDYHKGFENDCVEEFRYDRPLEHLYNRINGGYGMEKFELSLESEDR